MKHKHIITLLVIITTLLITSVMTVSAKKKKNAPPPVVTVETRWTPQEQLVSDTPDIRTVDFQLSARTDRQFWAMDISCLLDQPNIFQPSSGSQTMVWGTAWTEGNEATNHFDSTFDEDDVDTGLQYYHDSSNRINATVTRVGASNPAVGINGATYSEFLFSLNLTVEESLVGTTTVNITCDTITFLDRNGISLGDAVQSNLNDLTIREGYVITGNLARQGSSDVASIEISCEHLFSTNTHVTETLADGSSSGFSFSTAFGTSDPLREFGWYECTTISNLGGTEDTVLLQGSTFVNLRTPTYNLQPITLRTGDNDPDNTVDVDDFVAITTNWQQAQTAYTQGDVNGDGLVNEVDLAITAGNVGLSDDTEGVMMDHVIYSVARDFAGDFPNNTMSMGNVFSGDVSTLSTNRAFWPQMSPDGSQIAYSGTTTNYFDKKGRLLDGPGKKAVTIEVVNGVFIADSTNFNGSTIAVGDNFAPSWSPSGDQIAFICSWDGLRNGSVLEPGYQFNNGDLCVVGTSGGAVRTIIPSGALSTYAEIFPPAWYDETTIVYAGNTDNTLCPDQLCYYDMLTNTHGLLAISGVNGSATFANMPVIIRYDEGLNYIFYRHFDASDSEIRMGTAEYVSASGSWAGSGVQSFTIATPTLHQQVDNADSVHYYDVSPMLDVMFYEFGEVQFHNRYFVDGFPFTWTDGEDHMPDGFIGYPTTDELNLPWDGSNEDIGTDFHAMRATVDWIP